MGTILITLPDINESELVFNEEETRDILRFFWPTYSGHINRMEISTHVRRMAQGLLVSAIDASYGLGFVDALFTTVAKPGKSLASMGKKLARRYAKHIWKHATETDLQEAKIYEAIRKAIAYQCKYLLEAHLNGVAATRNRTAPFYTPGQISQIWA